MMDFCPVVNSTAHTFLQGIMGDEKIGKELTLGCDLISGVTVQEKSNLFWVQRPTSL